ncbi:putative ubiquinone biosynthesis monooxygenase [Sorochytrium milnesiophthora]
MRVPARLCHVGGGGSTNIAQQAIRARLLSGSAAAAPAPFYDIAIVGAGVAGSALATTLGCASFVGHGRMKLTGSSPTAQSPFLKQTKIALIDAGDLTKRYQPKDGEYSNRVVSLTPPTVRQLQKIGAWEHLPPHRPRPYSQIQVWDSVGGGAVHFDAQSVDSVALATMVETPLLASALLSRLDEVRGDGRVDLLSRSSVEDIAYEDDDKRYPLVKLSGGDNDRAFRAALVVGADGANSRVRKLAGIKLMQRSYNQWGVVATLHTNDPVNEIAWQRFLPTGPVAILPLSENLSSLVWSLPTALAHKIKALPRDTFLDLLNAALSLSPSELEHFFKHIRSTSDGVLKGDTEFGDDIRWRFNTFEESPEAHAEGTVVPPYIQDVEEGSRACFPLTLRHAERYFDKRVVLAGDAAHTIHPLAGQGLNLGMADVDALSRVLETAVQQGQDFGNPNVLLQYSAARYSANFAMLTACDKMHHLFGTSWKPIAWGRSLGFNAVDMLGPVKRRFVKYAMGTV